MKTSVRVLQTAVLLLLTLGARTALADQGIAYALVTNGASPVVSAENSLNPGGGPVTVSRVRLGVYILTFPNSGIDAGWSVQATAYGSDSNYCTVVAWVASQVEVQCSNSSGAAADSGFTVLAVSNANDKNIAFAWADQAATASYTPNTGYSYNPAGGVSITRLGTGTYTVQFSGLTGTGGTAQVTAYNTNASCYSNGWFSGALSVACFNPAGSLVDSQFVVDVIPAGVSPTGIAFTTANNDTAAIYTPTASSTYNPTGAPVSIARSSPGQYALTFSNLDIAQVKGGNVLVSAAGGLARCKIASWAPAAASGLQVNVGCSGLSGSSLDAQFEVLVLPPAGYAFAEIRNGSTASIIPTSAVNPGGATVTATRVSTGTYQVNFPHSGIDTGWSVQATAFGATSDYCKITGWAGGVVNVLCLNVAGTATDSPFSVMAVSTSNDQSIAFVLADQPTAASYTPDPLHSYNPAGAITASRTAAGTYSLSFNGLSTFGGDIQITALGSGNAYCFPTLWQAPNLNVVCTNPIDAPVDTKFVAWVVALPATPTLAGWALADQPTAGSYTSSGLFSYNPTGGAITVVRGGTGVYQLKFTGMESTQASAGSAHATTFGSINQCHASDWGRSVGNPSDILVNVNCYDLTGAPADVEFEVLLFAPVVGPAATLSAGSTLSTEVGTAFPTMSTTATDAAGNPVPGVAVTFTAPASGASGTFPGGSQTTVVTNASGVAAAPTFTANSTAGGYSLTASAPGVAAPATFSLTNTVLAITSISQISAQQNQTITITGSGFSSLAPYTGDSSSILVFDTTAGWTGGFHGTFQGANLNDGVTLIVNSWTDNQIVLGGFAGFYGAGFTLSPGDQVTIYVWNAQLGNGPVSITTTVASSGACTIGLSASAVNVPPTGTSTVETCPNNSGQPNCGVLSEVPLTFTVTPAGACGAWTATSSNPGFLQVVNGATGAGAGTVTYQRLVNTHTTTQNDTITVTSGTASAVFTVDEAGSGDSQFYREIYALYGGLLGRDPDAGGFAFWSALGGVGLGQMADDFLTSPEAFNTDFAVMAVYQAATGAAPTYAQFAATVPGIRAGTQTVAGLFNSLIGPGYSATTLYQNLLNRAPSASEIASANAAGMAGWFETLIGYPGTVTPISSPNNEFQSTGIFQTTIAADHSNGLYVRMIYYVTLGRDLDAGGFAFWVGIANGGGPGLLFQGQAGYATRISILGSGAPNEGFIGSTEFQGLFAN